MKLVDRAGAINELTEEFILELSIEDMLYIVRDRIMTVLDENNDDELVELAEERDWEFDVVEGDGDHGSLCTCDPHKEAV